MEVFRKFLLLLDFFYDDLVCLCWFGYRIYNIIKLKNGLV